MPKIPFPFSAARGILVSPLWMSLREAGFFPSSRNLLSFFRHEYSFLSARLQLTSLLFLFRSLSLAFSLFPLFFLGDFLAIVLRGGMDAPFFLRIEKDVLFCVRVPFF